MTMPAPSAVWFCNRLRREAYDVRCWVLELARPPDVCIHRPGSMGGGPVGGRVGSDEAFPLPRVRHAAARHGALAACGTSK